MPLAKTPSVDPLIRTYAINDAMNQLLLANLDPKAWRAAAPGKKGSGRTIASIFTHIHNCRLVWIRHSAPHLKCPAPLDPRRSTIKQTVSALKKSHAQCLAMLRDALSRDLHRKVTKFDRGAWAPIWPADGVMFAYIFSHEAHHRGQIIMLAHQLGYRLPVHAAYGVWHWQKLWKQVR
jgi:uncharacterized damage-inducible protein DinB